jgi:hypothetical protein
MKSATITATVTLTGDGRNEVIILVPLQSPVAVNSLLPPVTNPNSPAYYVQVPIGQTAGVMINTPVGLPNSIVYAMLLVDIPAGLGSFLTIGGSSGDTGVHWNASAPAFITNYPQPPPNFYIFNPLDVGVVIDVWYI